MNTSTPPAKRALALDALRGAAILLMVLSGRIPFGVLPDWMYHAQVPPPLHTFNPNLPGITWVDLVFPFFLFSMGAAIPLALRRRIEQEAPTLNLVFSLIGRWLLLAAFAIYSQHIRPWSMSANPDWYVWSFCLVGFLLLFPMYARLPDSWSAAKRWTVRAIGWGGAACLMTFIRFADGSGFSLAKSDIIILVLSNVALVGGVIWLITRENIPLRLGILALFLALRLGYVEDGWVKWIWNSSPAPWLFQVRFLQYLFLVIPGTIIGDLLVKWMNVSERTLARGWKSSCTVLLAVVMIATNIVVVVGLKWRLVVETMLASLVLCAIAWHIIKKAHSETENSVRTIFQWGVCLLMLGFAFEPFEGGIKKDHATMSYYFVTGGLAIMILIAFIMMIDFLGKQRWCSLLITSGQNPLVAYAGVNSLVPPVLGLLGLDTIINTLSPTPWLGVLRGALMTYLVALAASYTAKKKIFLKT